MQYNRLVATWISTWSGVPVGIFATSVPIGGALGNDIAQLTPHANAPTLMALGLAGVLAAVTQAPMTAFIIFVEMVDGDSLVPCLMASALVPNRCVAPDQRAAVYLAGPIAVAALAEG